MKKILSFSFILILSHLIFAQNGPVNTKIVEPTNSFGYFSESFVHHLNSSKEEYFLSTLTSGLTEYFDVPPINIKRRFFSKIGANGLPVWNAILTNAENVNVLNGSHDFACVDANDNLYIICKPTSLAATFEDALGNIIDFSGDKHKLIKIDKNGKLLWNKDYTAFNSGIRLDNAGDIYLFGNNFSINNLPEKSLGIVKINGQNGNEIFTKNDFNLNTYQFIPVFDDNNNFYIFTEPIASSADTVFSTGTLNITLNTYGTNSLLMKFDSSGNPIFGKNFFQNASSSSFSYINDVKFDGTDLVVSGNLVTDKTKPFVGMDGTQIPNIYTKFYAGLIAKIDLNGNVKWEKDLQSSQNLQTEMYTNIALDEQKNIYAYITYKGLIHFNNVEYTFGNSLENKVISKFGSDGSLKYFKSVDNTGNAFQGRKYYNSIDVISNDTFNILGYTSNNYFLNFPLLNSVIPKLYIATFKAENLQTNENQNFNLKLYPNPTSDFLNIKSDLKISKIEIYDMGGKLFQTSKMNNEKVSVSKLPKGNYLINIQTENGVVNSKFIKN